jgi:choloylglycine hydrolase
MKRLLFFLACSLEACTGITLKAQDGSIVHGRTAEFGVDLELSLLFVPRFTPFTASTPAGPGFSAPSRYAAIGVTAYDSPLIIDGMNEKGLSVAIFYFPNYASYPANPANERALSPIDFCHYLLTQCANTEEVEALVPSLSIVPTILPHWGPTSPPFHYLVIDRLANSIVIEPTEGRLLIHPNPLGVITNSPTFDWHMTHLNQFASLSTLNPAPLTLAGVTFTPFGLGAGLLGLPGDFSPPSRFVRAALFSLTAAPSPTSLSASLQAFHILNQFDIPIGTVKELQDGVIHTEATLATCVRDPQLLLYYIRTEHNQNIQVVDLNRLDFSAKKPKRFSLSAFQPIQNITENFQ